MAADEPLTAEQIEALEHTFLGPTWKRNDDGSWFLPRYTLGWQIIAWCADYLLGDDGKPWKFTPEQMRFILWWYAVDETGRFVYRKGVLQRLKGWGKDPLLAVICLVEFVGPSRFSHFDDNGNPIAIPHRNAWVQVAAVSATQTKNTMKMFPILMSKKLIATYGIKAGAETIRAGHGRLLLEAVTSNYRTLEGGRATFTVLNETHHWVEGSGGHKMMETIDGNLTKMDSRYLCITNAYLPGEDSVAERLREGYNRILEGKALDTGVLYDTIEAHPKTPLTNEALSIVVPKIRGDAHWLRVETVIASILDSTGVSPARSRRMWLNQILADDDALFGPAEIRAVERREAPILRPKDMIVMGFDGGKTDDATALIAIRVSDNQTFNLGVWEKPDGPAGNNWVIDQEAVDSAVHDAFRVYDVVGFYADVALWESYITSWTEAYSERFLVKASASAAIAWDMRRSQQLVTRAHERFMTSILGVKIFFDGDLVLRRHALNAYRRVNNWGVSFSKQSRESPKKVDAYAAWMLAHECLHDLRTRGKKREVRSGVVHFM